MPSPDVKTAAMRRYRRLAEAEMEARVRLDRLGSLATKQWSLLTDEEKDAVHADEEGSPSLLSPQGAAILCGHAPTEFDELFGLEEPCPE